MALAISNALVIAIPRILYSDEASGELVLSAVVDFGASNNVIWWLIAVLAVILFLLWLIMTTGMYCCAKLRFPPILKQRQSYQRPIHVHQRQSVTIHPPPPHRAAPIPGSTVKIPTVQEPRVVQTWSSAQSRYAGTSGMSRSEFFKR